MRQMEDIVDNFRKLEAYASKTDSPLKRGDLTRLTTAFAIHRLANELQGIRTVLENHLTESKNERNNKG